jgi:hypothetical protein
MIFRLLLYHGIREDLRELFHGTYGGLLIKVSLDPVKADVSVPLTEEEIPASLSAT